MWTFGACAKGDKDFGDAVDEVRADPNFISDEADLKAEFQNCTNSNSRASCLATFSESTEKMFHACFEVYPSDLCSLHIDAIAEEHDWSLADEERTTALISDEDVTSFERECVTKGGQSACYTIFAARVESDFDICEDIWGGGDCKDVLTDIKSHARNEPGYVES
jgi:hypothetical protein